jgi:hypothetical protein
VSIANALICAVLFYGFLVLLGRSTIALCRHQSDPLETHAISPVIGVAVLTLLTTYLALLDIPLGSVSKNMALGIAIFATIILASRPAPSFEDNGILSRLKYLAPLLVTVLLVALPFIMGGYQFAILRGNGTDAFNYVTMADALSRYPLDWILAQTKETLAFQSPNLPLAQDLLKTRWSTSALLAFASSAFGISPVEFEYVFTLTLMAVLFNALVAALSATSSLNRLTIWLPVVFVVGFWGQFTLDIRAFSQIVALPILVVLIGWLLSHANRPGSILRYGVSLTAILSAALFFQYPEIVVAFLPGAGLIFLIRLWRAHRENSLTTDDVRSIVAMLFATLLLSAPLINFVIGFAVDQGRFAVNKSLGWESAYFVWMKNPIRGLWGGGINPGLDPYFDNIFAVIAFFITFLLTLGVLVRIVKVIALRQQWQKNLSEARLLLLAISGFVGAIVLVTRENPWAAGKVLSFFSILIPIWMALYLSNEKLKGSNSRLNNTSHSILTMAILGWGGMNLVFAGARIAHAVNGSDFPSYITQHGEYRRVNAEAVARMPYFNCPTGSSVAIFEPTVWGREYLTHVAEGRGFSAITPGFPQSRSAELERYGVQDQINCAVADRKYFDASSLSPIGNNPREFVAGQPGDQFVALIGLEGGYGIEMNRETATRYVWTGQQDVWITFLARASAYDVELKLCPGAIRGTNESLTVFVDVDGKRVSQHEVRECIDLNVGLVENKETKLQQVRLTSVDPRPAPTLLGLDPRDLRLRVEVSKVSLKDMGS